MSIVRQGISSMEIEQIIAQRVTNAIEEIAIYEVRTRVTRDSMDQVARQGAKVVKDVKNKRKWENGYDKKSSQQQSKQQKVKKACAAEPNNNDYECEIKYHPGKENVVTDALSMKERLKMRRMRAMSMTIHSGLKTKILEAQREATKDLKALKLENITMDLVMRLPRSSSGYDAIWVIVDRLTKSAHFLAIFEDFKMERLARIYINEIVTRHDTLEAVGILTFCWLSLLITTTTRALNMHLLKHCIGTMEKIIRIKERLKTARDRQKSYADKRCKPVESNVSDRVLLKVSPWKGVVRFGKKGKLAPRSEKINSKPSTRTFSPPHRLLPSSVELWGPEFL
nr:hypothetical protein [Tanacetum cinerariifolium]